ncbi:MAG: hypothetical protein ACYC7D_14130 [Nitrososphaerales archaeon]
MHVHVCWKQLWILDWLVSVSDKHLQELRRWEYVYPEHLVPSGGYYGNAYGGLTEPSTIYAASFEYADASRIPPL